MNLATMFLSAKQKVQLSIWEKFTLLFIAFQTPRGR